MYEAHVSVNVSDVKFHEDVVVSVNVTAGATGNVSVTVNGITKTQELDGDSKAQFTFEEVSVGNHIVNVTYAGDENFVFAVNDTEDVTVEKADSILDISVPDVVKVGDDAVIVVNVTNIGASRNVTIAVNGFEANATLENGAATFTVPASYLPEGEYSANITYSGDENYTEGNATQTLTVRYSDEMTCRR